MLSSLWSFFQDPTNQSTLAFVGGGVMASCSGLWVAFVYLTSNHKRNRAATTSSKNNVAQRNSSLAAGNNLTVGGSINLQQLPRSALGLGMLGLLIIGFAVWKSGDHTYIQNSNHVSSDIITTAATVQDDTDQLLGISNAGDLMKTMVEVKKEAEESSLEASKGIGLLVRAVLIEGGEEVKAWMRVLEAKADIEGRRKEIISGATEIGDPKLFRLPAGNYVVRADYGEASVDTEIEVRAGELTERTIILDAGHLRVGAVTTEGGEEVKAWMRVLEAKADIEGRRKEIISGATEIGDPKLFRLPAGNYVVRADYGEFSVDTEIEVRAGELTERTIVLDRDV